MAFGYYLGGALGDYFFKLTKKSRILVSSAGVILGAIFLATAMLSPIEARTQFFVFMSLTALFMPLSSANVIATVYDVTVPEVRSTAQAIEYFVENIGAAFAPILTGIVADAMSLQTSILSISLIAWALCFIFYLGALFTVDHDIHSLRAQMEERAKAM
jgi:MFS family permease